MRTKKLGMVMMGIILSMLLAACGSSSSSEPTDSNSTGAETETKQSDSLTIYTAFPEQEVLAYVSEFEKETGIKVNFVRLSAGQILARIQAEGNNPQASVWYGGPSDTLIAAANSGLLEPFEPSNSDILPEEFSDSEWNWTPIYVGALGFASNSDWLEREGIDPPTSWADLLKPEFADNVSVAHPASSGTSYTVLATLVQLMGEEDAIDYLKQLDGNIRQYTQSGSAPANNAGLGEVGVGIAFAHDILAPMKEGYPITLSFPEDGTGYEVGAVGIIKGGPADEVENAKKFIEWSVSKEAQDLYDKGGHYRLPINPEAIVPEGATPLTELDVIEYDAVWAGESREELINKFENEIRNQSAAQ
ncbi:ABC transporter substrate-binding protein [Alkalihalobacillus sp. MEB130]|uniref:ABC transporter substrate-binding protein n=1 Tax=Alkalihalobacillus sp. MEB130 TaxID=2976704 RepID=UPI0028DEB647|nr:ABC transporter substrate-binding protein [Alkalihalobacillus sp. MEB130]MDT8858943.1 ABC transporter substrate-binding protein [Alkalihalobacillus sp. MEB130]